MNSLVEALNFSGKQVWITGAGRGIGYAIAESFYRAGAQVTGLDCAFPQHEYPFATVKCDLRKPEEIRACCQRLFVENGQIDVLVNAAGILRFAEITELTEDDWQASLDVNVSAVFHVIQQCIPRFKQQKSGVIVNIASNAARVPRMGMAAYCASKAALESFSHCIALELAAYGVRCNLVSPGSTNTPMLQNMVSNDAGFERTIQGSLATFKNGIPLRKIAHPNDIANSVLFLASDLASHITLHNLVVDGGATLSA